LKILKEVYATEGTVSARRDKPGGVLKVSALSLSICPLAHCPHIPAFVQKRPNIQFQLVENDRFANFVEEKIDEAIRVGELRDSSLIIRRLAQNFTTPEFKRHLF